MIRNFAQLEKILQEDPVKRRVAVAPAQDLHTLQAVLQAASDGIIEPVLIGDAAKILEILAELSIRSEDLQIQDVTDPVDAVQAAADLARDGKVDCIMKGKIETGRLMKVLVNKERGIRQSDTMSILAFMESPHYHKVFAITDVGLLTYPDKQQKIDAIRNAVAAFHSLGIKRPKVAILAAVEKVNPKMPETVEANEIKEMGIDGCILEGPISLDLAMDEEAAKIKSYKSPVAGDADLLVVPDIVSGNIAAKALTVLGGGRTGGVVLGAMVPVLIVSRAATADDKYMSIVMGVLTGRRNGGR